MLSLPITLRLMLAAQPELVTPVLQVMQRVVTRHLLDHAGLKAGVGHGRRRHADPAFWVRAWLADPNADGNEARTLRPLQVAATTYRIAFGPRVGQKVLTLRGAMARGGRAREAVPHFAA